MEIYAYRYENEYRASTIDGKVEVRSASYSGALRGLAEALVEDGLLVFGGVTIDDPRYDETKRFEVDVDYWFEVVDGVPESARRTPTGIGHHFGFVSMDMFGDDVAFEAKILDSYWNGWAVPGFRLEEAKRVVEAMQDSAIGNVEEDVLFFYPGNSHTPDTVVKFSPMYAAEEGDAYQPELIRADEDGYFWIGGMEWCWSEVPNPNPPEKTTTEVPASIFVDHVDGKVVDVIVSPAEASAGYFGWRHTDEWWETVAEYLSTVADEEDDGRYLLRWEG